MEVWSILHEWDTCAASVKELEEELAAEESTDEEVEMAQEKIHYDVKRGVVTQQEVAVEEGQDEGEGKGDEEEPMCLSRLSVKAKGKHLVL